MMYRRMNPKELEKVIEEVKALKKVGLDPTAPERVKKAELQQEREIMSNVIDYII